MTFIDKETNELAYKIIGCAYNVYRALGPGLLENTCEACLCYELNRLNIKYERQKELPVLYELSSNLKTVEQFHPIHTAQIITYMKLSKIHLGLLINFFSTNLQHGIKRIIL